VAESVSFVSVSGEGHALLRRAELWHGLSTGFVRGVLFGAAPEESGAESADVVRRALGGQGALVV
jgi:hypothetical protein